MVVRTTRTPCCGSVGFADVGELRDPFVGPAILEEAGLLHVVMWYALILFAVAIPAAAAIIGRRRKSS